MFVRQYIRQQSGELISLADKMLKLYTSNLTPITYKLICWGGGNSWWHGIPQDVKVYFKLQL